MTRVTQPPEEPGQKPEDPGSPPGDQAAERWYQGTDPPAGQPAADARPADHADDPAPVRARIPATSLLREPRLRPERSLPRERSRPRKRSLPPRAGPGHCPATGPRPRPGHPISPRTGARWVRVAGPARLRNPGRLRDPGPPGIRGSAPARLRNAARRRGGTPRRDAGPPGTDSGPARVRAPAGDEPQAATGRRGSRRPGTGPTRPTRGPATSTGRARTRPWPSGGSGCWPGSSTPRSSWCWSARSGCPVRHVRAPDPGRAEPVPRRRQQPDGADRDLRGREQAVRLAGAGRDRRRADRHGLRLAAARPVGQDARASAPWGRWWSPPAPGPRSAAARRAAARPCTRCPRRSRSSARCSRRSTSSGCCRRPAAAVPARQDRADRGHQGQGPGRAAPARARGSLS